MNWEQYILILLAVLIGFSIYSILKDKKTGKKITGKTMITQYLKDAVLTSGYGERVLNGKKQFHNGIDFKAAHGTKLYSPFNGELSLIRPNSETAGNYVVVKLANNPYNDSKQYYVRFLHLDKINPILQLHDRIKKGDYLGNIGNTGFVSPKPTPENPHAGTHLHLDVYYIDSKGKNVFVDPTPLLKTI